jgi:hypothetical protein
MMWNEQNTTAIPAGAQFGERRVRKPFEIRRVARAGPQGET